MLLRALPVYPSVFFLILGHRPPMSLDTRVIGVSTHCLNGNFNQGIVGGGRRRQGGPAATRSGSAANEAEGIHTNTRQGQVFIEEPTLLSQQFQLFFSDTRIDTPQLLHAGQL